MHNGWDQVQLGDVATFLSGGTPKKEEDSYWGGDIPWISGATLTDRRLHSSDRRLTMHGVENGSRMAPRGATLILVRGMSLLEEIRIGQAARNIAFNQDVKALVPSPRVDAWFLTYSLLARRPELLRMVHQAGHGTGVLATDRLRALSIMLPSIREQRAITGVLGALDDLIDTNVSLTSALDSLFHAEWQRRYLALQGPGASLTLADLCGTQYGYTESATKEASGPRFLRVADINKKNWIDWASVPFCPISPEAHERYRLRRDDLVVARMADPGKAAIVDDEVDAVFASYLVRLIPKHPQRAQFLYGLLKSPYYAEYAAGAMTGSVQKNMNARVITGCRVELPSDQSLREFDALGRLLRSMIGEFVQEKAELTRTRNELLPLLLSGRVRVRDGAA